MNKLLRIVLIIPALLLFLGSCQKLKLPNEVPVCIEKKIKKIKREKEWNPPAEVWRWETGGVVYYYFTADCCDQLNFLYDENCQIVCAPDGGFTGAGDGNCPTFPDPVKKTLLWKD